VEIAVVKLKKYTLLGSDQIRGELIEIGSETLLGFTNSLIVFGIWKSIVVPIYRKGDKPDSLIIMRYHFFQLHTKCYPVSFFQA
jgi:hypothetical protein